LTVLCETGDDAEETVEHGLFSVREEMMLKKE
jgi:hypothetical protein